MEDCEDEPPKKARRGAAGKAAGKAARIQPALRNFENGEAEHAEDGLIIVDDRAASIGKASVLHAIESEASGEAWKQHMRADLLGAQSSIGNELDYHVGTAFIAESGTSNSSRSTSSKPMSSLEGGECSLEKEAGEQTQRRVRPRKSKDVVKIADSIDDEAEVTRREPAKLDLQETAPRTHASIMSEAPPKSETGSSGLQSILSQEALPNAQPSQPQAEPVPASNQPQVAGYTANAATEARAQKAESSMSAQDSNTEIERKPRVVDDACPTPGLAAPAPREGPPISDDATCGGPSGASPPPTLPAPPPPVAEPASPARAVPLISTKKAGRGCCPECGEHMRWHDHEAARSAQHSKRGPYERECPEWDCRNRYADDEDMRCESYHGNMTNRWHCEECDLDFCTQCAGLLPASSPYAYVAVLFGPKVSYVVEAALLGFCLKKHGTEIPFVLLHTSDVTVENRDLLRDIGWQLEKVAYLEDGDAMYDGSNQNRFAGVFTKLHALGLHRFDKIVLMDLDLLVRRNVDDLFERQAPSAMRRQGAGNAADGAEIPSKAFFNRECKLTGGINAGVMVLNPHKGDYCKMKAELADMAKNGVADGEKSRMPEQDYLTKFYVNQNMTWRHLGVNYNFQPHQLAFTYRKGNDDCRRLTQSKNHIAIAHFSATPKPVDYCVKAYDTPDRPMTREEFVEDVLIPKYKQGFDRDDRGEGPCEQRTRQEIEDKMVILTKILTKEWFETFDELCEEFPEVRELIDSKEKEDPAPRGQWVYYEDKGEGKSRGKDRGREKGNGKGKGRVGAMARGRREEWPRESIGAVGAGSSDDRGGRKPVIGARTARYASVIAPRVPMAARMRRFASHRLARRSRSPDARTSRPESGARGLKRDREGRGRSQPRTPRPPDKPPLAHLYKEQRHGARGSPPAPQRGKRALAKKSKHSGAPRPDLSSLRAVGLQPRLQDSSVSSEGAAGLVPWRRDVDEMRPPPPPPETSREPHRPALVQPVPGPPPGRPPPVPGPPSELAPQTPTHRANAKAEGTARMRRASFPSTMPSQAAAPKQPAARPKPAAVKCPDAATTSRMLASQRAAAPRFRPRLGPQATASSGRHGTDPIGAASSSGEGNRRQGAPWHRPQAEDDWRATFARSQAPPSQRWAQAPPPPPQRADAVEDPRAALQTLPPKAQAPEPASKPTVIGGRRRRTAIPPQEGRRT